MTSLVVRLRALFRRGIAESELDDELRYHLEREIERNIARGMTASAARDAARRAFGNVSHIKEEVRDTWGIGWFERLRQDTRFALRGFRHAPAFVLTVIATIALALGLNTTAFTIFNTYVLRPIQVRDPYSLYLVRYFDQHGRWHWFTQDEYDAMGSARAARGAETFAFSYVWTRMDRVPVAGMLVSGNAFQVLGTRVLLGRALLPEDARESSPSVILLSYDAWRGRLGADSSIVGRSVRIRGMPLTVVGVLAPEFQGFGGAPPDFYAPLSIIDRMQPVVRGERASAKTALRPVVRLAAAESEQQANAMLATWAVAAMHDRPDSLRPQRVLMQSLATALPQNDSGTWEAVAPLIVAFALVLLIACANVANIMLARALARQREIGIRLALGADRKRLVRQLLTECVLLALPAGLIGFLISRWTVQLGVRAMFATVPAPFAPYMKVLPLTPDLRVFAFILLAAVASALLFGLVPALRATRPDIVQASRGDFDTSFRPGRMRGVLVVVQIAVCALLLITTGVLLRSAARARNAQTGMRTANIVAVLPDERMRAAALRALDADSLVEAVAATLHTPVDGYWPTLPIGPAGTRDVEQVVYDFVSPNYFAMLGIRLLEGREFTTHEATNGEAIAIVSEAGARRLWPGQEPIGQYLQIKSDLPADSRVARVRMARVVGVAGNTVSGWVGTGLDRPIAYFPADRAEPGMRTLVQVRGNQAQAREQLEKDLDLALPTSPIDDIHTLDDFLAVQIYPFQAFSWVAAAVGAIALLLTIAGVYGVLSYLVTQRTKEIGIRMALGASIPRVVGMVVRQSLAFAAIGAAIGVTLALGASRVLATQIPMLDAFDVAAYAGGALVVIAASTAAAFAPARRSARIDPLRALREE